MDRNLKNKLARLQELLHTYGQTAAATGALMPREPGMVAVATGRDALMPREPGMVAVAFSGGVDSTLLLRVACDTLGPEKVTALHAVSCLIPLNDQIKAEALVVGPNGIGCSYLAVKVHPLSWPDFVNNSEQRCYVCKKNIYGAFHTELRRTGHAGRFSPPEDPSLPDTCLLDGTNTDDLLEHRPGLQAIRELSVKTPLAQAGFNKKDIRSLARQMGLTNFNQPSNSCLATRIPVHQEITMHLLERIGQAEQFLLDRGFPGCRIKPGQQHIVVQVKNNDLDLIGTPSSRRELTEFLESLGFPQVVLNIKARDMF